MVCAGAWLFFARSSFGGKLYVSVCPLVGNAIAKLVTISPMFVPFVRMRWGGLPLFCFRHHRHGNGGYVSKVKMPNPVGSADRMRMTGTGMGAAGGEPVVGAEGDDVMRQVPCFLSPFSADVGETPPNSRVPSLCSSATTPSPTWPAFSEESSRACKTTCRPPWFRGSFRPRSNRGLASTRRSGLSWDRGSWGLTWS